MRASRVLPFAVLLIGLLLIPRLAWWDRDPVELELGVAGPPAGSGMSNPPQGLDWILRHLKTRPAGRPVWAINPGELGPAKLRGLSAVYLAGGISGAMHWMEPSDGNEAAASTSRPPRVGEDLVRTRLPGWLRASDARTLSAFTSRGGAVIGEDGLLAAVGDSEAKWRMEDCFRVRWTGWVGLSVDDIGDPLQAPGWVLQRLRATGDVTTVSGPAVVFIKGDQILALREGIEIEQDVHEIAWLSSASLVSGEDVTSPVPYRGWFEVVSAKGGSEVLAEHRLSLTDWGEEKLASAGLPGTFPCLVGYRGAYAGFYMTASFSRNGPSDFWVQMAGYSSLASLLTSTFGAERERSFWEFYYPVVRQVVLEAGKSWEEA